LLAIICIFASISVDAQTQPNMDFDELPSEAFQYGYHLDVYWRSDGTRIVAVAPRRISRDIYILDDSLNQIARLEPDSDPIIAYIESYEVRGIAWSLDGNQLAVTLDTPIKDFLQIWDMSTQTPQTISEGIFNGLMAWQPTGNILAVAEENRIILLDTETWQIVRELKLPGDRFAENLVWKSDGTQLAANNVHGIVQVWDSTSEKVLFELNVENKTIVPAEIAQQGQKSYSQVDWEPNGDEIAFFDLTHSTVEVWDTKLEQMILSFSVNDQPYRGIIWADTRLITYGDWPEELIQFWDVETGHFLQEIDLDDGIFINRVEWNSETSELFYAISAQDRNFPDSIKLDKIQVPNNP
jgi:WD40 repeat protein